MDKVSDFRTECCWIGSHALFYNIFFAPEFFAITGKFICGEILYCLQYKTPAINGGKLRADKWTQESPAMTDVAEFAV